MHIPVPPLRERKDDIPLLFRMFVNICAAMNGTPPLSIRPDLLALLMEYPWPGNVRQMKNEVERAVALATSGSLCLDDLSADVREFFSAHLRRQPLRHETLYGREVDLLRQTLMETGGNKSEAARRLGLSREGLRKKLRRYGFDGENNA